jgi:5-methylthioribose kinase
MMTPSCPFPLISMEDHRSIQSAMDQLGIWHPSEDITSVDRAGPGNMNLVLRVTTNLQSVILKQSRPWVEKYPQIAAPSERILAEIDFYDRVSCNPSVTGRMPRVLAVCEPLRLMAMEDLGQAGDYTDLYSHHDVQQIPIGQAMAWLADLHSIPVAGNRAEIGNRSLRELNHAHIFVIPLSEPPAIPLDPICEGLEQLARGLRADTTLGKTAQKLGDRYLGVGKHLLHGDFYPGSWLRTDRGFRVIDPEFTFAGPVEFDLGVLAGHRILIGGGVDSPELIADAYESHGGRVVEPELLRQFAGMEVIRRLIGVAQLPLDATLDHRQGMLDIARVLLG